MEWVALGRAQGLQVGVPAPWAGVWVGQRCIALLRGGARARQRSRPRARMLALLEAGLQVSWPDPSSCGSSQPHPCPNLHLQIEPTSLLRSLEISDLLSCLSQPRHWPWSWVGLTSCLSSYLEFICPGLTPERLCDPPPWLSTGHSRGASSLPRSVGALREFFGFSGSWGLPDSSGIRCGGRPGLHHSEFHVSV